MRLCRSKMQKSLEKRVFEYCSKHHMLKKGDRVVLGVSGGADSVCLLFVLLALKEALDLQLYVVHVNHGIRKDAAEDAAYVKGICQENRIPFFLYEKNIPSIARERGCSEEEAGRQVRYEAFAEVLQEQNGTKIAVAHNSNDRAETMLFHLFRGTGLTGLSGIRPVRDRIIRPILCLERTEIEAYLTERGIAYQHDSTNDTDDYTRNKIRHNILPYAEQEIVRGCVGNMNRTADILEETENYIEEQVKKAIPECIVAKNKEDTLFLLDRQKVLQEHGLIQKRIILQLLKELSPMHKDITATHVEDILSLFTREGNRSIHLPYGIRGSRQYDRVLLERKREEAGVKKWEPAVIELDTLSAQEVVISPGRGQKLFLKVISVDEEGINCKDIPQNQYTKWFDYDKIKECLMFRTRQKGDFLCIKGSEALQHKKLKDYMIAEKIPKQRRDELPLLAEGSHVLWLIGYRISEYYKVEADTKHILQVCFK